MQISKSHFTVFYLAAFLFCAESIVRADDSNVHRAKSDIAAISIALNGFKKLSSSYPSTDQGLLILVKKPSNYKGKWAQFFSDIPMDPWNRPYQYRFPGTHNPDLYDVFSLGPDPQESSDDIGNWKEKTEQDAAANP